VRAGLSRPSHTAATRTLIGRSVTHCCELGSACAGRWSFDPSAGDVRVEDVDGKEQYETPAWIWKYWIHRERLDFDAHATALSAVLPSYSTAAAPVEPPACARIWLNPAYGRRCGGIGDALFHYVRRHVRERGCTLVALVPVLSHTDWFESEVMHAHEVHFVKTRVAFTNPFTDKDLHGYMIPQLIAVWRPGPVPTSPEQWGVWAPPTGACEDEVPSIVVRRCAMCCRWRLLPRYQDHDTRADTTFTCGALLDSTQRGCAAPRVVW